MRALFSIALFPLVAACGGPQRTTSPDESEDLTVSARSVGIPPGLDGTQWRWVEAHCTEGPLDLLARGYASTLRVHEEDNGLTLVRDQVFATEQCQHTVIVRAVPQGPELRMDEVTRVAVPSAPECFGRPEEPRPGEVRLAGDRLEVLTQRSQWCNGLEVRMVYERMPDAVLTEDQIVRRYVANFGRGDAQDMAALFAQTGSLLEPFTRTETGDPFRHDGRQAVERWFAQTFATSPWRAMRIVGVQEAPAAGGAAQRVVEWEYMDPRLSEPLTGRTRFTIAGGEIFEAQIELTSEPRERTPDAAAPEQSES